MTSTLDTGARRATALDHLDQERARLSAFNARIWSYAEPAWREHKSVRAYVDLLRAEGWAVEKGSGGMPTAFAARWGEGGPLVSSFAEYDAVPGNSQQVVPYPAPPSPPWTPPRRSSARGRAAAWAGPDGWRPCCPPTSTPPPTCAGRST